jgi:hypothetical protein
MKKFLLKISYFLLIWSAVSVGTANAAQLYVSVKNITHSIYFTPLFITAHSGETHLFRLGESASPELRAMAEGGDISGLSGLAGGIDTDTVENPAAGLLAPGASINDIFIDTDQTGNTLLSLVAMLLPTNDGFVGLDSLELPETPGIYTFYLNGYDAGTEANDELITGGGAPGVPGIPAAPGGDAGMDGTGVSSSDSNTKVHIHRGNLGDGDPSGGNSDLDFSIHRWLNPVAEVIIEIL